MLNFCDSPFSTINIQNKGDVYLCLCRPWTTKGKIGNIYDTGLRELWNGEWMQDFRSTIYDQSFKYCNPDRCWKANNLDKIETFQGLDIPALPTIIQLQDLDDNCNLKCPSCRLGLRYTDKPNPEVDKVLNHLIDVYQDFDRPVYISADGSGEFLSSRSYLNFLQRDNLPEHFYFYINTNGTLINKNIDLIERRKDKIKAFTFSLDAATPETYTRIRGHNFATVLSGIKKVKALGINVVAQFVVQQQNYKEITMYHELCQDLGVDFIGIQGLLHWGHPSDEWWAANRLEDNPAVDLDVLREQIIKFKKADSVSVGGTLDALLRNS